MPRGRRAKIVPDAGEEERISPPGQTIEARENQLILLATNLAERQLREGTASSQVIAHYLKLGSTRERLEQERLRQENNLARAKTDSYESMKQQEVDLQEVLKAFRYYNGEDEEEFYDD